MSLDDPACRQLRTRLAFHISVQPSGKSSGGDLLPLSVSLSDIDGSTSIVNLSAVGFQHCTSEVTFPDGCTSKMLTPGFRMIGMKDISFQKARSA